MLLEEIKPYMRFARVLEFTGFQEFTTSIPRDCRLFYTDSGLGSIQVQDRNYEMVPGSILLIHVGIPYRFWPADVTYLAFNFDYTFKSKQLDIPISPVSAASADDVKLIEDVEIQDVPELNNCLYLRDGFTQKGLLQKILADYTARLPLQELSGSAALNAVIVSVLREYRKNREPKKRIDMDAITAYVQEHFTESLTNRQVAEVFHFHPNYLSAVFKANYGKTLHQYVVEQRILAGLSMLEENKYSIEEISRAVGFYDCSHFSKCFKRIIGVSPKGYQR